MTQPLDINNAIAKVAIALGNGQRLAITELRAQGSRSGITAVFIISPHSL